MRSCLHPLATVHQPCLQGIATDKLWALMQAPPQQSGNTQAMWHASEPYFVASLVPSLRKVQAISKTALCMQQDLQAVKSMGGMVGEDFLSKLDCLRKRPVHGAVLEVETDLLGRPLDEQAAHKKWRCACTPSPHMAMHAE